MYLIPSPTHTPSSTDLPCFLISPLGRLSLPRLCAHADCTLLVVWPKGRPAPQCAGSNRVRLPPWACRIRRMSPHSERWSCHRPFSWHPIPRHRRRPCPSSIHRPLLI